ncbi:hypothetical protein CBR_g31916 [Chara braunii]|uniref:Uncharacterized protein n=1 Tax=Chara braunii TaxID=69332 RepID=A0A388LG12_CHABU|nr:hypothetical protein CBR_g31916 [Chara braunii]|eukprot:GBG81244.1 hypothetical protein CBR_g31916 [Chara braunii]
MQEMERPLHLYAKEDAKDDGSYNVHSSTNGSPRQLTDDDEEDIFSSVDVEVDTNLLDVDDLISRDDARGDLENYHRGEGGGSGSNDLKLVNE